MIIVMKSGCPQAEIELLFTKLCRWAIVPEVYVGKDKTVIALVGDTQEIDTRQVQNLSQYIEQVLRRSENSCKNIYGVCALPLAPLQFRV